PDGVARAPDLAAPGAAGVVPRLPRRDAIAVRHLVGVRLALRDDRRDGAPGLLGPVRPPPGPQDPHPPHGRDAPVLPGPRGSRAMELRRATPEEKTKIYEENARRMLRLRLK